jgi:protein involved in polysaccharide export with SLBB domain
MSTKIKMKTKVLLLALIISGCKAPGMHMSEGSNIFGDKKSVYIETIDENVNIVNIEDNLELKDSYEYDYRIGNGDQIAITVWGLNEIFPLTSISSDLNLRRVDSNGNIYFPYIGLLKASGTTQDELRSAITRGLANYFTDPQVDVSIARFNSQKIYMLGEITSPQKLNITDIPLTLAEALGEVKGLRTETSAGSGVFIIRQAADGQQPTIFRADLSSPAGFISAGSFYLTDNDIVYVNANSTTRWNRVISQFFPFSSFVSSVDNLLDD